MMTECGDMDVGDISRGHMEKLMFKYLGGLPPRDDIPILRKIWAEMRDAAEQLTADVVHEYLAAKDPTFAALAKQLSSTCSPCIKSLHETLEGEGFATMGLTTTGLLVRITEVMDRSELAKTVSRTSAEGTQTLLDLFSSYTPNTQTNASA